VCEHIGVILSIKRYFAWRIFILKGKNWTCAPNYEILWSLQCERHTNLRYVQLHILQFLKTGNEKMGKNHMNAQRWQCELVNLILENKKDICMIQAKICNWIVDLEVWFKGEIAFKIKRKTWLNFNYSST
jgi:hypothetical protein